MFLGRGTSIINYQLISIEFLVNHQNVLFWNISYLGTTKIFISNFSAMSGILNNRIRNVHSYRGETNKLI